MVPIFMVVNHRQNISLGFILRREAMPKHGQNIRVLCMKEKLDIVCIIDNGTTKTTVVHAWGMSLTTVCGI